MHETQPVTIVVIDDEPEILRATTRLLEQAGYNVISGETGALALELTRKHMPALLLLDVMLPFFNGVDIAREIKSDSTLASVFVVLTSGIKTTSEDQAAGLAAGLADGYIARPFGKVEFLARIDGLLRLHKSQQLLHDAVREKEALLKEVYHRVKNNLQVISSLLRLEAGRSAQAETKNVLLDMQGRIRSMSMLHESLYLSGTFTSVDLSAYLKQLATRVFRSITLSSGSVNLELDLVEVSVSIDQATHCGILVNELLSNCFKHGFPESHSGEVRVELQIIDGHIVLCVSDTGIGLADHIASKCDSSLGLQLISDVAQQLGGELLITPGIVSGVRFTVGFMASSAADEP